MRQPEINPAPIIYLYSQALSTAGFFSPCMVHAQQGYNQLHSFIVTMLLAVGDFGPTGNPNLVGPEESAASHWGVLLMRVN
jgi:hypothetical protein